MTALTKYARLEATALWRATPQDQRREVVVSIGDATLIITDLQDRPLTHWSLAAVERANPGTRPAIYHPDGDPGETLELPEDEAEMIDGIEKLRRAILPSRPHPGRLRWLGMALSAAAVAAVAIFWMPGALRDHTLKVVPQVKRAQLGKAILGRIERVAGPRCNDPLGTDALATLGARLGTGPLAVLPQLPRTSLHLPGGLILLDSRVVEDHEEPDVAAGFILTEALHATRDDALHDLLRHLGLRENLRLLTTGDVSAAALDRYAETLAASAAPRPPLEAHLAVFEAAGVRSKPYAFALDSTGESTLDLIEGDPMTGRLTEPLMTDADWIRLQGICSG